MAHRNKVLTSVNRDGDVECVDIFERADGDFGFGHYRRDPEDGRGWFELGAFSAERFATRAEAETAAMAAVPWLRQRRRDQSGR